MSTLPPGLAEAFIGAAERAQREASLVSLAGDGADCPSCGTPMRRLEYRHSPDGPVVLRREVCPSCKAETRVLSPGGQP